jgi:hypothetical protein
MSAVIAIIVMLVLVVGLIGFCVLNAVRIRRHMNHSLNAFRSRLEDEANSVLDALFKANHRDDGPPRSADTSQPTASE